MKGRSISKCTQQFYFKDNMAQGRLIDINQFIGISLLDYREEIKRPLLKVKLVTLFDGKVQKFFGEMLPFIKNINDSRKEKICQWKWV